MNEFQKSKVQRLVDSGCFEDEEAFVEFAVQSTIMTYDGYRTEPPSIEKNDFKPSIWERITIAVSELNRDVGLLFVALAAIIIIALTFNPSRISDIDNIDYYMFLIALASPFIVIDLTS